MQVRDLRDRPLEFMEGEEGGVGMGMGSYLEKKNIIQIQFERKMSGLFKLKKMFVGRVLKNYVVRRIVRRKLPHKNKKKKTSSVVGSIRAFTCSCRLYIFVHVFMQCRIKVIFVFQLSSFLVAGCE